MSNTTIEKVAIVMHCNSNSVPENLYEHFMPYLYARRLSSHLKMWQSHAALHGYMLRLAALVPLTSPSLLNNVSVNCVKCICTRITHYSTDIMMLVFVQKTTFS